MESNGRCAAGLALCRTVRRRAPGSVSSLQSTSSSTSSSSVASPCFFSLPLAYKNLSLPRLNVWNFISIIRLHHQHLRFRCPFSFVFSLSISVLSSTSSVFIPAMDCRGKLARDSSSPFDCLMFDLDDTLYPSKTGIAEACRKNIEDFLVERCGFPESKASTLRVELFKDYGSSLAGLRALGYDIDADDYHSFVHGRLPYERIKPDYQLRNLLISITQRKIIFTNSDRNHATKVLYRLGVEDCVEQIICFETLNPNLCGATRPDEFPIVLKPSLDAMKIAVDIATINPRRTLFLDDNVRNVAAGKSLGFQTALIGTTSNNYEADYTMETINNLAQVIPEIWYSGPVINNRTMGPTSRDLETLLTVPT